ncbi:hypothetical protein ACFQYP_44900 [Nonomuraea antimicrobica]
MASLTERVASVRAWGRAGLERWRVRRPSLDHLLRAVQRYEVQSGDRLAGAVTYFAFLSFFPLVALSYAVLGFTVATSETTRHALQTAIEERLPGIAAQLPSRTSPGPRRPPGSSACSVSSTPGSARSTSCAGRCARCR